MTPERLRADALKLREEGGSTFVGIVDSLNQAALHIENQEKELAREIGLRDLTQKAIGEMLEAHKPFNILSFWQPKVSRGSWMQAYVTRTMLRKILEINL